MICFLISLLVSTSAPAQTLEIHGRNSRFELRVKLTDLTGRGLFSARRTRVDEFYFEYIPNTSPRSPREFHLVDIFGRRRIEFGLDDIDVRPTGTGIAASGDGASGYYLRFRLTKRARQIVSRYRYIGLSVGPYGSPRSPHHVLILNDEEDYEDDHFRMSTWHRLDVGDRVFLETLLTCESNLTAVP